MTIKELKAKFPQFVIKEEKDKIVVFLGEEEYKYKQQYEWKFLQCIYPKENLIFKK